MTEPEHEPQRIEDPDLDASGDTDDEEASSPFDHPAFLPVLLWGLAIWFGRDGWFNPEIKSIWFNRIFFVVLSVLGLYFTIQSIRETRARDEKGPES